MISEENLGGLEEELNGDIQKVYLKILDDKFTEYIEMSKMITPLDREFETKKEENLLLEPPKDPLYLLMSRYWDSFDINWCVEFNRRRKDFCEIIPNHDMPEMKEVLRKGYLRILKELVGIVPSKRFFKRYPELSWKLEELQ